MQTNVTLLLLLLGLAITILSGCAERATLKVRYEVEKLTYQAERLLEDLQHKPEDLREADRSQAGHLFSQAMARSLSVLADDAVQARPVIHTELKYLAFRSATQLSRLHFAAGRYDSCAIVLKNLQTKVALDRDQSMTAKFNLGQALQASDRWDSALVCYQQVLQQHYPPVDDSGSVIANLVGLPLHLWQTCQTVGDTVAGRALLVQAGEYYQGLLADYPTGKLARAVRIRLAYLLEANAEYERALNQWLAVLEPERSEYLDHLFHVGQLLTNQMNRADSALSIYSSLRANLPPDDTTAIPRAMHLSAEAMTAKRRFDQARQLLVTVKRQYPVYYQRTPAAQQAMARTFDLQSNWNRAESEYKFLIEKYRGSDEALAAHLYLAEHFRSMNRLAEADRWYELLATAAQDLGRREASPQWDGRSLYWQGRLAAAQEDWSMAANLFQSAFAKYPFSSIGRQAALEAQEILLGRLHQPDSADSLRNHLRAAFSQPIPLEM